MSTTSDSSIIVTPFDAAQMTDLIRVHRESFQGYMNTKLGNAYLRAFFDWFRTLPRGMCLVARDASQNILGYVAGAPLDEKDSLNRALLKSAIWGMITHPWLVVDRRIMGTALQRIDTLLGRKPPVRPDEPDLPTPTMSLVGIGVSSAARSRGVGRLLMEGFERRARELQMPAVRLSVYSHNPTARRLYEKCGWTPGTVPENPAVAMYYWKLLK